MTKVRVIRHVPEEALGRLESVLVEEGIALDVVDVFAPDWPQIERDGLATDRLAGLIVMGGPMNVDQVERYPFLASEQDWLREAVSIEMPTLGICLGAQLLARSLGADVYRHKIKEIGWYGLEMLPPALDDPLLAGAPTTQTVFQWHGDTFDLPENAVLLARGATCRHQAFRYGPSAYGLQFHPEMTVEMVGDWFDDPQMLADAAGESHVDIRQIRQRAKVEIANSTALVEQIFRNFAELCRQFQASNSIPS